MRTLVISGIVLFLALAAVLFYLIQGRSIDPSTYTRSNILYNASFELVDGKLPEGWSDGGTDGVRVMQAPNAYTYTPGGNSVEMYGASTYLKSPTVEVRPGQKYRITLRVIGESKTESRMRVWFHWLDVEGDEVRVTKDAWQTVPSAHKEWVAVEAVAEAPPEAARLAISLRPGADDRIFIDDLSLTAAGVYVDTWPDGKAAALSLSVDWETAMGGLIHTKSNENQGQVDVQTAIARGLRMREGTSRLLELLAPHQLQATWFANGYNFLRGNVEGRAFMRNPTFAWADDRGYPARWGTTTWFADDPRGTAESDPAWYFGDLLPRLRAAGQSIQSHTFSHFHAGFAEPEELRADLEAWIEVAGEAGVEPASALAFPWSGNDGMTYEKWSLLHEHGVRAVTRTTNSERYHVERFDLMVPRPLPALDELVVIPDWDATLGPATLDETLALLKRAVSNGGALDVWAHTEEITTPEQIAAWRTLIETAVARGDLWVAPVSEIAGRWRAARQVRVEVLAEGAPLRLRLINDSDQRIEGLSLRLPIEAASSESGGQPYGRAQDDRLVVDLEAGQTVEVDVWPAR